MLPTERLREIEVNLSPEVKVRIMLLQDTATTAPPASTKRKALSPKREKADLKKKIQTTSCGGTHCRQEIQLAKGQIVRST